MKPGLGGRPPRPCDPRAPAHCRAGLGSGGRGCRPGPGEHRARQLSASHPRPSPGPFFSPGGQPAPAGPPAGQTKPQSLDPFADLGDLSASLQGIVRDVAGYTECRAARGSVRSSVLSSCSLTRLRRPRQALTCAAKTQATAAGVAGLPCRGALTQLAPWQTGAGPGPAGHRGMHGAVWGAGTQQGPRIVALSPLELIRHPRDSGCRGPCSSSKST